MSTFPLKRLREVFAQVYASPESAFYRTLYAPIANEVSQGFPLDQDAWEKLPLLTKEQLVQTPFFDRLFVPWHKAHSVRVSSGTSGRGVVLIPRNFHIDRSYFKEKFTKMLCFYVPHFGMDEACEPHGLGHIGAVPEDMPATARMATLFGIDALAGACSPILTFLPTLRTAYDTTVIRYIHLWGERPSPVQFQELQSFCPRAEISWEYSNIESGGQSGRSCPALETLRDDRVHPLEERYFWELIDPDTGSVVTEYDKEGEIVLTTLWDGNAIPVLRYRTGDLAKRVAKTCSCDVSTVFQILGRVQYDRAIIPGGELKSEELERVLEVFASDIESNFELHVVHQTHELPQLTLFVRPRRAAVSLDQIATYLTTHMRIGASRTIADSVAEGLLQPVRCAHLPMSDKKTRRIVRAR